MHRKLTSMLIALVMVCALLAVSSCESARAPDASAIVLPSDSEIVSPAFAPIQVTHGVYTVREGWIKERQAEAAYFVTAPAQKVELPKKHGHLISAHVRGKPKSSGFSGLGYDHFARADV